MLVEQERYRMIAIESDCTMGLVVDDYVTSGRGTLDEVMERGFSRWFGAYVLGALLSSGLNQRSLGRERGTHARLEAA